MCMFQCQQIKIIQQDFNPTPEFLLLKTQYNSLQGIDHFIWKLLKGMSAISSSPYPNIHGQLYGHHRLLPQQ